MFNVNDRVKVESDIFLQKFGKIIRIDNEADYEYEVLTQDGMFQMFPEERISLCDPYQALLKGDVLLGGDIPKITVHAVCGDLVGCGDEYRSGYWFHWQEIKGKGYTLQSAPQEDDIVERYTKKINDELTSMEDLSDAIKPILTDFKKELEK